jgi:hypothetical protein
MAAIGSIESKNNSNAPSGENLSGCEQLVIKWGENERWDAMFCQVGDLPSLAVNKINLSAGGCDMDGGIEDL